MASVDRARGELSVKIVYYGPALSGRMTSMAHVHAATPASRRTEITQRDGGPPGERYFTMLLEWLSPVQGWRVRLDLHTVGGALWNEAARIQLVDGADAAIFVADSQIERMEANVEALASLGGFIAHQGRALDEVPLVLQYNKRDLPSAVSVATLDAALNARNAPRFESVAPRGVGVLEAVTAAAQLALERASPSALP